MIKWKVSQFKGGRKWICMDIRAWATYRKGHPLNVGLAGNWLGEWAMTPEEARSKLEQMHGEILKSN